MSNSEQYRENCLDRAKQEQYENRMHRNASSRNIPFQRGGYAPLVVKRESPTVKEHWLIAWLKRIVKRIIRRGG